MLNAVNSAVKLGYNFLWYTAYPDELPALITYELPKMAFETTTSMAQWGAKQICNLGEKLTNGGVLPPEKTTFIFNQEPSKIQAFCNTTYPLTEQAR